MSDLHTCSVAEFGSRVRKDNDSYSDRDTLIVYPTGAYPKFAVDGLSAAGDSCTTYSRRRISRLAESGSLFIQHLVKESRIIQDADEFLASLLFEYEPKASYADVFADSVQIFSLVESIPMHNRGVSWAADVVAVAFRAMAIPYLADHGIYAFGMSDICLALKKLGRLSAQDASRLPALRKFKSDYRRTGMTNCTNVELTGLISIIDRCFSVDLHCRFASQKELFVMLHENPVTQWYRGVRLLEAILLASAATNHSNLHHLQKMIISPQIYGWQMRYHRNEILETLDNVSNAANREA